MITSAQEFCRLRESSNPQEYLRAATEAAPIGVWREIISSRPDMRIWVVLNKAVPLAILEELAESPDVDVRESVARKRKVTDAIAVRLAKDKEETVRAALARNRKLSESVLRILRLDTSQLVQEALESRRKNG